jgi:hypothetical protein
MTQDQSNEYMRNVKWTTAGIVFSSTISLIVALVWFFSDIKGDIESVRVQVKDARTEAREQLTGAVTSINRRIDSNEYNHKNEIQAIWLIINSKYPKETGTHVGLYTERVDIINGKRVTRLVPVH